jgi:hypothetical protein
MIDVPLANVSNDDLILQYLSFESSMALLISFDIEPLAAKVEQASKLGLTYFTRWSYEERPSSIFYDLRSERREVVEFEKQKYRAAALGSVVDF